MEKKPISSLVVGVIIGLSLILLSLVILSPRDPGMCQIIWPSRRWQNWTLAQ